MFSSPFTIAKIYYTLRTARQSHAQMMKFYKTHRLKKGACNKNAHAAMHKIIQQSTEGQIFTKQTFQIPDNPFGYVIGNIQGWSESKNGCYIKTKGR